MSLQLKSVEEELKDCRDAWEKSRYYKVNRSDYFHGDYFHGGLVKYGVHIHHEELAERTVYIEDRIQYILRNKPFEERALRLRLMRPVKVTLYNKYVKAIDLISEMEVLFDTNISINSNKASLDMDDAYVSVKKVFHAFLCKEPNCPYNGVTILT